MKNVIVTIKGGTVVDCDVPKGIRLIIHDYDVDVYEEDILKDQNGDIYEQAVYEKK